MGVRPDIGWGARQWPGVVELCRVVEELRRLSLGVLSLGVLSLRGCCPWGVLSLAGAVPGECCPWGGLSLGGRCP